MKMEGLLPLHLCHSQYNSIPPPYTLRFLFLVFTIFMACLTHSSRACPGFKCGENYFPYPFGKKNSGCGDPALQLECDPRVNMPLINITGHQYYILNISHNWYEAENWNEDHTITIIDKNLWGERCDPSLSNNSTEFWSSTQFHIIDGYKNLTLWEKCLTDTTEYSHPLPCNDNWYFSLEEGSNLSSVCKSQVTLPVKMDLQSPDIQDEIDAGFRIKWNLTKNCWDCWSHGGSFAYDPNTIECYCNCESSTNPDCSSGNSATKPAKSHDEPNILGNSATKPAKSHDKSIILGCSAGGAVLIAVLLFFIYYVRRRKASPTRGFTSNFSPDQGTDKEEGHRGYMVGHLRIFSYQELQQATNFFDEKNELGDGGFGAVYLGKLEDGRAVAVKRLYQQNSRRFEQFINEVQILSSLYHPNLVRLYGCTSAESPILLLVYEFVSNGTLADHLHGSRRTPRGLPWETRIKIAKQTAQALAYLHSIDPPIFHRDVKSNNILVDEHFEAKVADFGLSRLMPVNVSHVTTAPQGTPGYVDPEYHECFQLTEKSDVYSFGVVLVEIISAKVAVDIMRNRNEISLANMFIDKIRRGVLDELVDPDLKIQKNHEVKAMVAAVAELAFECLAGERDLRPCMKEVVARLEQIKEMQQQSTESSKLSSFSPIASPLSAPIMGSERGGQNWVPLSL